MLLSRGVRTSISSIARGRDLAFKLAPVAKQCIEFHVDRRCTMEAARRSIDRAVGRMGGNPAQLAQDVSSSGTS